jgi:toxin ParE1/3/4
VKTYTIVFTPEADDQLTEIYQYIASAASPDIAERYVSAIIDYCESLQIFPERGIRRDDIRPDLRITNYKGRAVIAFTVDTNSVIIIGVFFGGQNYEAFLQIDLSE